MRRELAWTKIASMKVGRMKLGCMNVIFAVALLVCASGVRGQETQEPPPPAAAIMEGSAPGEAGPVIIQGNAMGDGPQLTIQAGPAGEAGQVMVQAGTVNGEAGVGEAGAFFENHIELLGFGGGARASKVVKGAPFSAVATSETTQTLADGNHIAHKTQTALYRDSVGRFRKEVTLPAIGPLAASGKPHSFIEISDPVAGTSYVLEPDQKVAREARGPVRMQFSDKTGPGGPGPGGPGANVIYRKLKDKESLEAENAKTESLGMQTIAGVNAEGTRITRTIPAGQIGNEKPITIVSEHWYSSDLQMDVQSTHSDPRFGNTTYTLTNIQRTEPAATLFAVPSDYSVEQGHRGKLFLNGAPPPPPDN